MPSPISIRDTGEWRRTVTERRPIFLDPKAEYNANLIGQAIKLARPALPHFNLHDNGIDYLARSVSYLLRPDLLQSADEVYHVKMMMRDLSGVDLLTSILAEVEDPDLIVPGFELRTKQGFEQLKPVAAEWFRCYAATLEAVDVLRNGLTDDGNPLTPSYILADVTTFMLNPKQLKDAVYTRFDHDSFEKRMEAAVQ
jgi:hypothetical protein